MSYKYSKEEINEHRLARNEHEEKTDKLLLSWINKYFPNTYIINRTDEWENYDYLIYSIPKQTYCKLECKTRNFTMEQYNKYSVDGFALSYDKINYSDDIIYFIPITNEVLQIKTNKIKELLTSGKINTTVKKVNRYQYTSKKDRHDETLVMIPKQYWKVYYM